jgi:hypothetical protein
MARVREPPPMASNDDSASLLVDYGWSPAAAAPARSSPLRRLLHGGKATTRPAGAAAAAAATTTTTTRSHDVKRFICSPFAAVFRAMSCARDSAVSTCDGQRSSNATAGVAERLREARKRRPSLEQLLRMEAPPPASARRPDHHRKLGKPREAVAPYEVIISSGAVKGKEQEPLFPSPQSRFVAAVSDDADDAERRRRTTIVPVKLEPGGPGRRQTNAKRLVVVFASLRACSWAPRINDGKVAAGRAPGNKADLFYYRPIPMGRRCRVQHLEESPYVASSDLSSLLNLEQM